MLYFGGFSLSGIYMIDQKGYPSRKSVRGLIFYICNIYSNVRIFIIMLYREYAGGSWVEKNTG